MKKSPTLTPKPALTQHEMGLRGHVPPVECQAIGAGAEVRVGLGGGKKRFDRETTGPQNSTEVHYVLLGALVQ